MSISNGPDGFDWTEDPATCPECDHELSGDRYGGECTNPDCDFTWENIPASAELRDEW